MIVVRLTLVSNQIWSSKEILLRLCKILFINSPNSSFKYWNINHLILFCTKMVGGVVNGKFIILATLEIITIKSLIFPYKYRTLVLSYTHISLLTFVLSSLFLSFHNWRNMKLCYKLYNKINNHTQNNTLFLYLIYYFKRNWYILTNICL